jgi:hypothetical protein
MRARRSPHPLSLLGPLPRKRGRTAARGRNDVLRWLRMRFDMIDGSRPVSPKAGR